MLITERGESFKFLIPLKLTHHHACYFSASNIEDLLGLQQERSLHLNGHWKTTANRMMFFTFSTCDMLQMVCVLFFALFSVQWAIAVAWIFSLCFFLGFWLFLCHLPIERNLCVSQCKKESMPAWWERKKGCCGAQSSKVLMHLHRFWDQPKMADASRCSLRNGAKDGGGCSSSSADFSWSCNTC